MWLVFPDFIPVAFSKLVLFNKQRTGTERRDDIVLIRLEVRMRLGKNAADGRVNFNVFDGVRVNRADLQSAGLVLVEQASRCSTLNPVFSLLKPVVQNAKPCKLTDGHVRKPPLIGF